VLVLTRKSGESIHIGEDIRVTILSVQGQSVKVGILAPREVAIPREEIYEKIVEENQLAASRASLKRAQMLMEFNHGREDDHGPSEAQELHDGGGVEAGLLILDNAGISDDSELMTPPGESEQDPSQSEPSLVYPTEDG